MELAFESVVVDIIGSFLQIAAFVEIDSGCVGSIDAVDDDDDFAMVYKDGALCESFECDDGMFND